MLEACLVERVKARSSSCS